jgi:hypothetical protein
MSCRSAGVGIRTNGSRVSWLLLPIVFGVLLAACDGGPLDPEAEYAAALRAVDAWVATNPEEWRLERPLSRTVGYPHWSSECAANPSSGYTALHIQEAGLDMLLFFRCPSSGGLDVADIGDAFAWAVIDEVPHRISSRGWRFTLLTPSSSFEEQVVFSIAPGGRLRISMDTPLYAVYGHSTRPRCQPPADAPSPEGCYLLREHRVPLRLELSVPLPGPRI